MEQEELLARLAEQLEDHLWNCSRARLRALREDLLDSIARQGVTIREVFEYVSDESLVLAIKKDFLAGVAFEELFEHRYKRLLYYWCLRWGVLTFQDAEDLIYSLFLKLWKRRFRTYKVRGQSSSNFRAWLWRVARNLWIQVRRKKKAQSLEGLPEPSANGQTPVQALLTQELKALIEEALARLREHNEKDWQVMHLLLQGRSSAEISAQLDLSKAAVAMRLFRVRRYLAEQLKLPEEAGPS